MVGLQVGGVSCPGFHKRDLPGLVGGGLKSGVLTGGGVFLERTGRYHAVLGGRRAEVCVGWCGGWA